MKHSGNNGITTPNGKAGVHPRSEEREGNLVSSGDDMLDAIKRNKIADVEKILTEATSFDFLLKQVDNGYSPLSFMLTFYTCKEPIPQAIEKFLPNTYKGTKQELVGKEFVRMRGAVLGNFLGEEYSHYPSALDYITNHYFKYVYTATSIAKFEESFNEASFNNEAYLAPYKPNQSNVLNLMG